MPGYAPRRPRSVIISSSRLRTALFDAFCSCVRIEHGFTGLVIASIVIPLILMIFAFALDMMRVPLTEFGLRRLLVQSAISAERRAFETEAGKNALIDPALPAGNNLASKLSSGSGSGVVEPPGGPQGIIDGASAAVLAAAACRSAVDDMSSAASPMFIAGGGWADKRYSFQFAVVRFLADGTVQAVEDPAECSGGGLTLDDFDWRVISERMRLSFDTAELGGAPRGAGLWYIEAQGELYSEAAGGIEEGDLLPSVWIVGVGAVEVKHLLGGILFGQESTLVRDYFVRPFNAPAAIEAPQPLRINRVPPRGPLARGTPAGIEPISPPS